MCYCLNEFQGYVVEESRRQLIHVRLYLGFNKHLIRCIAEWNESSQKLHVLNTLVKAVSIVTTDPSPAEGDEAPQLSEARPHKEQQRSN